MDHPRASFQWSSTAADDDPDWEVVSETTSNALPASPLGHSSSLSAQEKSLEVAVTIPGSSSSASHLNDIVSARLVATSVSPPRRLPSDPNTMPGWKDEYLTSLLEAERNNPVNLELVEACSDLNNRIAALEAEKAQWQATTKTTTKTAAAPSSTEPLPSIPPSATDDNTNPNEPHVLRLRTDLATTLRQNSALETRLRKATTELTHLRSQSKSQARQVQTLTTERDGLRLKVRDQNEELRIKKQMLEQVQDDVLALEMQLNVAEQQKAQIAAENKHLIERWMRRAREEADSMNAANERGL